MTQGDLEREVALIVEARIDARQPTSAPWLVQEIIAAHPAIEGEDPLYLLCAGAHVQDTVRAVVQRYRVREEDTDPQLALPGFERLQRAYLVEREGDRVVVPLVVLLPEEAETKARELERMGTGCFTHADELRRYMRSRQECA